MTTAELPAVLITGWERVFAGRSLSDWQKVGDADLPIPDEFVQQAAYYLHLRHGRSHGRDLADWFEAQAQLRQEFRQYIALLSREERESFTAANWDLDAEMGRRPSSDRSFHPKMIAGTGARRATGNESCSGPFRPGKISHMSKLRKVRNISGDDPEFREALEGFARYRDPVTRMTDADRVKYQGKLLAILSETGEIIAAEWTLQALQQAVGSSEYKGRDWRLLDGPSGEPPIPIAELEEDSASD